MIPRPFVRRVVPMLFLLLLIASLAQADSIWACVDQVSVDSYSDYLNNYLFTHDGDNRDQAQPDHVAARQSIYNCFTSYGLDTSIDHGVISGYTYDNVVGVHQGTGSGVYVIGAHYDSVANPGADDNASGVAGVLEAARIQSQYDSEATIVFIAFDREEDGLWGSRAWAQAHSTWDIRGMISMDMIAYNPAGAYYNAARIYGRPASDPWRSDLASALNTYGGITATLMGQLDASDHAPFEWLGFDAALLIEYNAFSNPHYHQLTDSVDTPNYIDYHYAANMTRGAVGLLADRAGSYAPEPGTLALIVPALVALRLRMCGRRRVTVTLLRYPGN